MPVALPETWGQARHRIVPVVRGVCRPPGSVRLALLEPDQALVRRPFAPFLSELLALDLENLRVFVRRVHLDAWGVGEEAAYVTALGNLEPGAGLQLRPDGVWRLASGDGLESSRLALPGWLGAFTSQVGGRPVAAIPHARELLVTGMTDLARLDRLVSLAVEAYRDAGDPVSPSLYTLDDGGRLVPWAPEPDHPLHARVRRSHLLLAGHEYTAQIDEVEGMDDLPAPPAAFALVASPQGVFSLARWHEAEPRLLPITDVVVLHPMAGEPVAVARAILLQIAPDTLALHPDLDPPRLVPRRWPTGAELRALREEAVEVPVP